MYKQQIYSIFVIDLSSITLTKNHFFVKSKNVKDNSSAKNKKNETDDYMIKIHILTCDFKSCPGFRFFFNKKLAW